MPRCGPASHAGAGVPRAERPRMGGFPIAITWWCWRGLGYRQRTLKNVQNSDGTVIVYSNAFSDGTKLTRDMSVREKKPIVVRAAAQVSLA